MHPDELNLTLSPHSLEAEQSLIGAALVAPGIVDLVGDILKVEHFYRDDHQVIWRHICALDAVGRAVDVLTTFDSLQRAGLADRVGGLVYLGEMAAASFGSVNARQYAQIIRDRAMLRGMAATGQRMIEMARGIGGETIADKLSAADGMVAALSESSANSGALPLAAVLDKSLTAMQASAEGRTRRMTTGLIDLDAKVYDYQPGALVIIAGRPGMGKTSLALQIARHTAEKYGPVYIASMEMPDVQIGDRLMSMESGVPLTRLTDGNLNEDEWSFVSAALGRTHELPMHIDEKGGQTASEIRAKAQQLRRKSGGHLGGVFIDYLQLMSSTGDNQNERISNITRELKSMAKLLQCPVVLLSQLNREVEKRPNKRPFMSDLRDSGAIEQDADLILFPYRDEVYHSDSPDKGTAEIDIAKQRNGPTGNVRVGWKGECATFTNLNFLEWSASKPMRHEKPAKAREGFR